MRCGTGPAGGSVRLSLDRRDSKYAITVADTGAVVPAEAQPHIFSRFYRADKTRSRAGAADGMREKLGISEDLFRSCLQEHYVLTPIALEFLPFGLDTRSGVWSFLEG